MDAASGGAQNGGVFSSILMLVGFLLIFYFMIWRPQSQKAREQRELLDGLAVGDEVVTSSGIAGSVTKITDHFVVLDLGTDMPVTIQKQAINSLLPKGTLKSV